MRCKAHLHVACSPVQIEVDVLHLAVLCKSVMNVLLACLLMDASHENDPALHSCSGRNGSSTLVQRAHIAIFERQNVMHMFTSISTCAHATRRPGSDAAAPHSNPSLARADAVEVISRSFSEIRQSLLLLLEKLGARRKNSHFAGPGPEPASRVSYDPRAPFLVSSVSMRSLKPLPFCFLTLLTVDLTLCGCSASIISSSYCSRLAMMALPVKPQTIFPQTGY